MKQFKNDKNYILKKIQLETKEKLLKKLIKTSTILYNKKSNPLGLIDKTTDKLKKTKEINYKSLNFFYNKLSTIYRYNHGEVQLSFCGMEPLTKNTIETDGNLSSKEKLIECHKTFHF